jgi:SAM-dependent methyltransferase
MSSGDFYASPFGAAYSFYMERPWLARIISRLVWGGDPRPYYEGMQAVASVPDGGTVVDCPSGAGPALRALTPRQNLRYIAVDSSPSMLRRIRKRADAQGLSNVELLEADAAALSLPSASADLFLSLWGLHCFDDPRAALTEAARILAPGGRLIGCCFVRGDDTLRQRLLVRPGTGDFGAYIGTAPEVESWLQATGLDPQRVTRSGPMLYFQASKAA